MLLRYEQVEKHRVKAGPQARTVQVTPDLHRLADSLVKDGQLQPIGLLEDCRLVFGFRRAAAAMLRGEITHLWAAVFSEAITEEEFLRLRAAENFQKIDLSPWEKFLTLDEYRRRANPSKTLAAIAEDLHLDPGSVTRFMSVGRCLPAVQEALKSGAIGISDCYIMSREPEQRQHELLAAKLAGASRDEVQRRAKAQPSDRVAVKLDRVKIALPGGAAVVLTGQSLGMAEVGERLAEALKECRKAAPQHDVKTWQRMMANRARTGG